MIFLHIKKNYYMNINILFFSVLLYESCTYYLLILYFKEVQSLLCTHYIKMDKTSWINSGLYMYICSVSVPKMLKLNIIHFIIDSSASQITCISHLCMDVYYFSVFFVKGCLPYLLSFYLFCIGYIRLTLKILK